jgi:hypothetical protein
MRSMDIPEVLIVLGFLGTLGLAIYNWMHQHRDVPGHK